MQKITESIITDIKKIFLQACVHYGLDLYIFKKELFSTSAINALDQLNFLKVEDELNLLEWMSGVLERGWFLSDHCLKLYLIFKLNQNHYNVYFGDERFKNRPSTNWINRKFFFDIKQFEKNLLVTYIFSSTKSLQYQPNQKTILFTQAFISSI